MSLPPTATSTTYLVTTDGVPAHAGWSVEYNLNGVLVSIGRNLGQDNRPEPDFAKRVDSGVVVWVKASDAGLRKYLLDSATYSADLDQQDEG